MLIKTPLTWLNDAPKDKGLSYIFRNVRESYWWVRIRSVFDCFFKTGLFRVVTQCTCCMQRLRLQGKQMSKAVRINKSLFGLRRNQWQFDCFNSCISNNCGRVMDGNWLLMESVLIEKEVGMIHNDDQCQSFSELHVSISQKNSYLQ